MRTLTAFVLAALIALSGATAAQAQTFSSVQVLNGSCSAPSFTFKNDSDSGFYLLSAGTIAICINGAEVGRITSNGLASSGGSAVNVDQTTGTVTAATTSYAGTPSKQALAGDLNLAAGAGTSTALSSAYLAGVMGNVLFDGALTDTENLVSGVIGKYNITGTNAALSAKGAVIGEVSGAKAGQVSSSADGAFVAVIGGDEGAVQARAAYTVDFNNTGNHGTNLSYFRFFADTQGPGAHSGYMTGRYNDGFFRLGGIFSNAGALETVEDMCILGGTTAPTDGTSGTGAGQCAAGSVYFRQGGASSNIYTQRGTKASPTWVAAI